MNGRRRAFTLLELLIVTAIMGLLGTVSIGGFRAMRQGMEQRSVTDIVEKFLESARLRAVIDRQPVAVYFWNETLKDEDGDDGTLVVVGRAVAVRRAGRITAKNGKYLIDEFGDFRFDVATDDEGEEDDDSANQKGALQRYLYRMNGQETGSVENNRSLVAIDSEDRSEDLGTMSMMTDPDWIDSHAGEAGYVSAYGYYTADANKWKVGDAYGLEFAEMSLPNNYIFGSSYSEKATQSPITYCTDSVHIQPPGKTISGQPQICVLRAGSDGKLTAKSFTTKK